MKETGQAISETLFNRQLCIITSTTQRNSCYRQSVEIKIKICIALFVSTRKRNYLNLQCTFSEVTLALWRRWFWCQPNNFNFAMRLHQNSLKHFHKPWSLTGVKSVSNCDVRPVLIMTLFPGVLTSLEIELSDIAVGGVRTCGEYH